MNLNPDSFFMKKFLQYDRYTLPDTICQLGRRIVIFSIIWTIAATVLLTAAVALGVTAFGLLVVAFTDATIVSWFGDAFKDGVPLTFAGFCLHVSTGLLGGGSIVGAAIGIPYGFNAYREHRKTQKWLAQNAAEAKGETYVPPSQPVTDFFSGLYKRFKDKTCVMITYKRKNDEPVEPDYEW